MDTKTAREVNQATYRRLKEEIDHAYPHGRFVAILDGRVEADAPSFDALAVALGAGGKAINQALIVQAGVGYLETAVIFVSGCT